MCSQVLLAGPRGTPCLGRYIRQDGLASGGRHVFLFRPFAMHEQQARCGAIGHTFLYFLDAPRGGSWIVATLLGNSFSGPKRLHYAARYDVRHPNDIPMTRWRTRNGTHAVLIQTWCGSSQRGLRWQDLQHLRAKMAREMKSAAAAALEAQNEDGTSRRDATRWPPWARVAVLTTAAIMAVFFARRNQTVGKRARGAGASAGIRNSVLPYQSITTYDGDFEFEPTRLVETRTDEDLVPL